MMEIFCHTYSYMPMIGFNRNGKSSNAHLDFIRKETGKVKSQVQRTDMYRQLRPIRVFRQLRSASEELCASKSSPFVIDETPNPKRKKKKFTRNPGIICENSNTGDP